MKPLNKTVVYTVIAILLGTVTMVAPLALLGPNEMDDMLCRGAKWAVDHGYGTAKDLMHIEEHGCMPQAKPKYVSDQAKKRQQKQVGTLGSGNHYMEIQQNIILIRREYIQQNFYI